MKVSKTTTTVDKKSSKTGIVPHTFIILGFVNKIKELNPRTAAGLFHQDETTTFMGTAIFMDGTEESHLAKSLFKDGRKYVEGVDKTRR